VTHVFHRSPRDVYAVAVRGEGAYLFDREGRRYLDASGGAAVSCLGHSDQAVIRAVQEQIARLPFAHTSFFTNEPMEALADALVQRAPAPLDRVYFVSGGSEAMEAALKLARQYFVEKGEPQRRHLIARRQSYHGNTLGALAVGGNAWRREPFAPLLMDAHHIAPCYEYRGKPVEETEEQYGLRLARELDEKIRELGPETVIGFVAETVGGATAGCVPPVPGYFKAVREVCDRHGVLLIGDEVMAGFGRTGKWFAVDNYDVVPDIITMAKGINSGYVPLGALSVRKHLADWIENNMFAGGLTYSGHPLACAAAVASINIFREEGIVENAAAMGQHVGAELARLQAKHPSVGEVRGLGLFWGLELVRDRATKTLTVTVAERDDLKIHVGDAGPGKRKFQLPETPPAPPVPPMPPAP